MKKGDKILLALPVTALFLLIAVYSIFNSPVFSTTLAVADAPSVKTSVSYDGVVCITKIHGKTGMKEEIGCEHNNITYIGLNLTRDFLGAFRTTTSNGNFTIIALCNATAGCGSSQNVGVGMGFTNGTNAGGGTESPNNKEYISNGLTRQVGTFTLLPNVAGNYSLFTTFTSSGVANLQLNATALFNQTAIASGWNGTMFAVNKFNDVTLDGTSGEQLTVNWTVFIS